MRPQFCILIVLFDVVLQLLDTFFAGVRKISRENKTVVKISVIDPTEKPLRHSTVTAITPVPFIRNGAPYSAQTHTTSVDLRLIAGI